MTSKKNNPWNKLNDNFYHQKKWKLLRKKKIELNPVCELHLAYNEVIPAQVIDHAIPRRFERNLELEIENLQSLCYQCHGTKTAQESNLQTYAEFVFALKNGALKWSIALNQLEFVYNFIEEKKKKGQIKPF